MYKYFFFLIITIICMFSLAGCRKVQFDFNQSLPYVNARLNEIFPSAIRNSPGNTIKIDVPDGRYIGYTGSYLDDDITITVVKCVDNELTFEQLLLQKEPTKAALEYFNKVIKAKFKAMSGHTLGYIDGYWQAYGKDKEGRRWLAWVNSLWVYMLSGKSQADFDLAVRACRFVSKKSEKE